MSEVNSLLVIIIIILFLHAFYHCENRTIIRDFVGIFLNGGGGGGAGFGLIHNCTGVHIFTNF